MQSAHELSKSTPLKGSLCYALIKNRSDLVAPCARVAGSEQHDAMDRQSRAAEFRTDTSSELDNPQD